MCRPLRRLGLSDQEGMNTWNWQSSKTRCSNLKRAVCPSNLANTSFTLVGNAADSPGRNHLEEHQLLGGGLLWHPTPGRSSLVNH
jgi:hypothetical protein